MFGPNLRASVTKDMGPSLQGGWAVVKVALTPTSIATGQELQFIQYISHFLSLWWSRFEMDTLKYAGS